MSDLPNSVAFIGLGLMGFPMAQNLVKKLPEGAVINIYDISSDAMDRLVNEASSGRVKRCESSKEAAGISDTIITMLPEGQHVRDAYLTSTTGIINADLSHKLLIDSSTIDAATSLEVSSALTAQHPTATFTDAPVSGGVLGAERGSLTFMLGLSPSSAALPRTRALLELLGSQILPCGGPGLGITAKLCNNYTSGLIAIATAEAMNVGIRAGMDPRVLSEVFSVSLAGSVINDKWNPCPGVCPDAPASKGYKGGFRVDLMRKDFKLATEMAERVGARLALGETGLDVYTKAMEDERCKGLDSRVVYRYLDGEEEWEKKLKKEE